jgi:hydrogenase-4 component E
MGHPASDMVHLLGGAVLVLSFALLFQRRIETIIGLYAVQGIIVAAAAAWQGWAQTSLDLVLSAIIALAANGIAIPLVLRRILGRHKLPRAADSALGVFPAMVLGTVLVALSILAVLPTAFAAEALTREDLALALSVVLLGLLTMITRRGALGQAVGLLSLENGLVLAATGVAGLPLVVALSVAMLVLVGFVVLGIFAFRLRDSFDLLDAPHGDGS